jgi:carboxyl-terminal processing protease
MEQFEFENKKRRKLKKEVIWIIACVICMIVGLGGGYFISNHQNSQVAKKSEDIFSQVSQIVNGRFVDTSESEYSLQERMLAGMIAGLGDPHSSYLTSQQAQDLTTTLNGSFEGIGLSFSTISYGALVLEVFDQSPADKAGILKGDIITHVEGTSIAGYDSDKIQSVIKGEKDTKVSVQILRDGKKQTFQMKRGNVESSVAYQIRQYKGNQIGYIRMTTFGDMTAPLVEEALKSFQKQKIKKICIDLRGNGGGYLDAAQKILDYFISEGEVMYQTQSKNGNKEEYKATSCQKYVFEKGFILVDGDTASASEVMTSALSEVLSYKVIGETTYGKGTVQSQIPFSDSSILKLTTSKWLTSQGTWVNKKGIKPDYVVKNISLSDFSAAPLKTSYHYDEVNDYIKNMQKELKTLGYKIDRTDGYFSKKTKQILEKFEKDYGLKVNGVYEKDDAKVLLSALTHYVYQKAIDLQYQKMLSL